MCRQLRACLRLRPRLLWRLALGGGSGEIHIHAAERCAQDGVGQQLLAAKHIHLLSARISLRRQDACLCSTLSGSGDYVDADRGADLLPNRAAKSAGEHGAEVGERALGCAQCLCPQQRIALVNL